MTVRELETRMPFTEVLDWIEYLSPPEAKGKVEGNLLDMDANAMTTLMTKGR